MSSLMDQTTDYDKLHEKYSGFVVPTIELKIEGSTLPEKVSSCIGNLSLVLTAETSQMNVLDFTVEHVYNYEKPGFDNELIEKYFKIGNRIEASLGYLTTELLFIGYIYEVHFKLDVNEGINISVSCKDFKGLLENKQGDLKRLGCSRVGEVRNIFFYPPYTRYARLGLTQLVYLTGLEILDGILQVMGMVTEEIDPESTELQRIQTVAQMYMYEFFTFLDEIYFRPCFIREKDDIMELAPGRGILSVSASFNIGKIIDMFEVRGQSEDDFGQVWGLAIKPVPSSVTTNTTALGSKVILDPNVTTRIEAFKKAFLMLGGSLLKSSSVQIQCIGIPDIIPGRYIKLAGLSDNLNKSMYVNRVIHQINSEGYTTQIIGRTKVYGQ
ncbi:MAG: hypothetical protein K0S71_3037 [Clostridia bacterium]|jgi:hypothetical protein|nr:hypothetical protein [Clostridia bacterium]